MKRILRVLLAATLTGLLWCRADFYVSPKGDDSGPGSESKPFATLERARDAIRQLKRPLDGPVTVWVGGGIYELKRGFQLAERDSGSPTAPVTYRSRGGETPRLMGGKVVHGFEKVTNQALLDRLDPAARDHVLQLDLRGQGVANLGRLRSRGWGRPTQTAYTELFFNGEPMPLARWPNEGQWTQIAGFPQDATKSDAHGGRIGKIENGFFYDGDRPRRWKDLTNVWVHGFWAWQWANSYERIESIDLNRRWIHNAQPGGHFGFRPGQRIYFLNVIEELDAPGEWFIDTEAGMLYFWPPKSVDSAEVIASVIEDPIIRTENAHDLFFRGLVLEAGRSSGIEFHGGRTNQIAACVIRNTGTHGVVVDGGRNESVVACDIYNTGDCGVTMVAGNRQTLDPAHHVVENCHFHHNGRWTYTYVPAIKFQGVGLRAAHNVIHDHPHCAILFEGNEHELEYNEIYHVATETGDVGAIYSGRDWTYRGNHIRFNSIREVSGMDGSGQGIYLDDCMSSAEVYGNVFYKLKRGVHLAGGRDHRVINNIFVDCDTSIDIDGRGLDGSPIWRSAQKVLRDDAKKVPWDLYVSRYPELRTVEPYLKAEKGVPPEGNVIARNISVGGKFMALRQFATKSYLEEKDNLVDVDPKFENRKALDFRLKKKSPAFKLGFQELPLAEIGLQETELRKEVGRLAGSLP